MKYSWRRRAVEKARSLTVDRAVSGDFIPHWDVTFVVGRGTEV